MTARPPAGRGVRSLAERGVRGIVLDIEGTTTPIAFVHDVLFPYARARLRGALATHGGEWGTAIDLLRDEQARDGITGDPADYAAKLMDEDRKSPGLKLLQGKIWEEGYRDGALAGEVFDDVLPALRRWHDARLALAIYSSGSVLAQRLLFGTTPWGDLTPCFDFFFDTAVGAKRDPASYRRIVATMHLDAGALLFISDTPAELDAAAAAGMQVLCAIRPGNVTEPPPGTESIRSFDELPLGAGG